ncbi:IPIL1 protein, partial [Penelope pileata]|nr:IPIL1 protein [Penelope pileata]
GWSALEGNVLYCLLVPLKPPPGYTFCIELGDAEERLARKSCVCVELECTCERERLLGDVMYFLHHAKDKSRGKHEPSLLDTFCKCSYLHMEKTMHWFWSEVKASWNRLAQPRDCCLTVLPSCHSCKIKVTSTSMTTSTIEMMLGVQLDDLDTFLRLSR